jgi:hypothetical protein
LPHQIVRRRRQGGEEVIETLGRRFSGGGDFSERRSVRISRWGAESGRREFVEMKQEMMTGTNE